MNSTQESIYEFTAKPILDDIFKGFNGTIFAYGQTGSGKTHTMMGNIESIEESGIIPRIVNNIFNKISESPDNIEFKVIIGMIQLYNEKIYDLFNNSNKNLRVL